MASHYEKDFHTWMVLTKSRLSRHQLHKNAKAQKEQVIAFLKEPGEYDLIDRKVLIDLAAFEERFERLKTTKNLSLISENALNLVFEICNDEKPRTVYGSLVQLLIKLSSATIASDPSMPTKPAPIETKDQLRKQWESILVGNNLNTLFAKIQQYKVDLEGDLVLEGHRVCAK